MIPPSFPTSVISKVDQAVDLVTAFLLVGWMVQWLVHQCNPNLNVWVVLLYLWSPPSHSFSVL